MLPLLWWKDTEFYINIYKEYEKVQYTLQVIFIWNIYLVYRILAKEKRHPYDRQQCNCIIQNMWEIRSTYFSSWHSCSLTAMSTSWLSCLLPMCEEITSNRIDFVNKSTSQSAHVSFCKLQKNQSFFIWTSVIKKSFENTLPHHLASFVKISLWIHEWLLIFFSGLNFPFKCG